MSLNKNWQQQLYLVMLSASMLSLPSCAHSASKPVYLPESQRIYLIKSGSVLPTSEGAVTSTTDLWAVPSGEYLRLQQLGNCALIRGCE